MSREFREFIHKKDPTLQSSQAVMHEQSRRKRAGLEIHGKPLDKLVDWMTILQHTHGHKDPHVLERIREFYFKKYVIEPEDIPESVFLLEQRIAREMGYGAVELTDEFRSRKRHQIIQDQKDSLNLWINELLSDDFPYAPEVKYWIFMSVVKMGRFEKFEDEQGREMAHFLPRTKDTVAPFPPLNARALSIAIAAVSTKLTEAKKPPKEREQFEHTTQLTNKEFEQLLSSESFSKIYAQFLIDLPEYSREGLEETRGRWVLYPQGSDPGPLVQSLVGYPLEWCTANRETAKFQLDGGDFHVYYSFDKDGNPVVPRLAIRMEGQTKIAEPPRGIAPSQNLDPYIGNVLEEKLKEFGSEGESYKKKANDMRYLTSVEKKMQEGQILTREDIIFLYEIDAPIEGFGNSADPRIVELRNQRNIKEDMSLYFECSPAQIAYSVGEITDTTKAYVGKIETGVFELISKFDIDYIYTSFPEGKIQMISISIGGKAAGELLEKMKASQIDVVPRAIFMMQNDNFAIAEQKESSNYVFLTVEDLGFPNGTTLGDIYSRADELGLDLCLPEVGPYLRLKYERERLKDDLLIAMEPIDSSAQYGHASIFSIHDTHDPARGGRVAYLGVNPGDLDEQYNWGRTFVFRLRNPERQ